MRKHFKESEERKTLKDWQNTSRGIADTFTILDSQTIREGDDRGNARGFKIKALRDFGSVRFESDKERILMGDSLYTFRNLFIEEINNSTKGYTSSMPLVFTEELAGVEVEYTVEVTNVYKDDNKNTILFKKSSVLQVDFFIYLPKKYGSFDNLLFSERDLVILKNNFTTVWDSVLKVYKEVFKRIDFDLPYSISEFIDIR
jgi:hypothetical protein